MKHKAHVKFHLNAILEELEARQLFSGGIEGIMADNNKLEAAIHMEVSAEPESTSPDLSTLVTADSLHQELVFIDTDVENYQELLNDILAQSADGRNIVVILLDNESDGIEQITETLANYKNLDAIHLISHGSDGNVDIGNSQLNLDTLNQNLAQISDWSDAFSEDGDFLIYGCNLATTEDGQSLVQSLSSLTQADVAASDDLTGQAKLGGNWDLEFNTGTIESTIAISTEVQQEWNSVLIGEPEIIATETADLNDDGFIDAIHVTFSEAISDSTVIANDWDVAGVTGEAFSSITNGDTADDADIYITFTDGVLNTGATPNLSYTQDDPTDVDAQDLAGNLLANSSGGAWWDVQWLTRTQITFTGNDASGTENLDDFTVLVSLTASNVDFDKIKTGGADIRFVDSDDTTSLEYQIESWDDSAKTATIWVKVPRIDAGSTSDNIYLYYNNAAATDASSTAAWDSKHQGVWHLNEGTGATQVDATINTNDATAVSNPTTTVGKEGLGGALNFSSTSELNIAANASLDLSTYSDWTISAWVKPTDYTGVKWPLVYSYGIYDASLGLTVQEGTEGLIENWTNDSKILQSNTAVTLNEWNHIAISRDATTTTFYLNGVEVGSSASTTVNNTGMVSYIGGNNTFASDQFIGLIDEVRVSAGSDTTSSRSAEWMAAQYSSMNLTFNTYAAEESHSIMTDKTTPVVSSVVMSDSVLKVGETSTLTITFSEMVTGFDNTDITLPNGTLNAISSADGGITWTGTFTPADIIEDTSNIISVGTNFMDLVGNAPLAGKDSVNYTIDTIEPTITITDDTAGTATDDVIYTFTFDEAVSGFAAADITVTGGSKGTFTAVSRTVYTLMVTPTDNSTANITVNVAANVAQDPAGNFNDTSTQSVQSVDTVEPTVTITDDTVGTATSDVIYTFTFEEAVTGFVAADITVTGGSKGTFTAVSGTVYTLVVTPTDNSTTNITVDVAANVAQDTAGNNNSASTQSVQVVDTIKPSVTITDDTAGTATGDVTYTFTFNKPVTGFTAADITVSGGTKGTFTAFSDTVYTLVIIPSDNSTANITVYVAANVAQDTAGNNNSASTQSVQVVDTIKPTLTITDDTAGTATGDVTYTFTFNESVTGFTAADITVTGGTKGTFTAFSDTVYTLVIIPSDNSTANITVDVAANMTQDTAGNNNNASTQSVQAVDTIEPVVTSVVMSDNTLLAGETSTLTITFSKVINNFDNSDITLQNGTLTAVKSADGGITWTGTFTPIDDIEDTTNVISVGTTLTDLAGKAPLAGNSSANYSIETSTPVDPTIAKVIPDTSVAKITAPTGQTINKNNKLITSLNNKSESDDVIYTLITKTPMPIPASISSDDTDNQSSSSDDEFFNDYKNKTSTDSTFEKPQRVIDQWIESQLSILKDFDQPLDEVQPLFEQSKDNRNEVLWKRVEFMRNQMDADKELLDKNNIEFVAGATVSLTAGVVRWALRGRTLLSNRFSSTSLFKNFDPVTIAFNNPGNIEHNKTTDDKDENNIKIEAMFTDK